MKQPLRYILVFLAWLAVAQFAERVLGEGVDFESQVAAILERRCLSCHSDAVHKGGLSLATREKAFAGGDNGEVLFPGDVESSTLFDAIGGDEPTMPKDGPPLAPEEVAALREWVAAGAAWPEGRVLADNKVIDANWWSLKPLSLPEPLAVLSSDEPLVRTPIDRFILASLREQGLSMSSEADRRTLLRRLTFDLWGLPPTPEETDRFLADDDPRAYERLVDRLLDSPHYGERWARHWLDVVHYGDTHGFDKDKVRPNAWPYRDYVIRSLNDDKPYSQFVREQLAGDVLAPDSPEGIVATGFIAAGPWDFVGQVELREGTIDKAITRNLDRDDMVATAMNTFVSLTAQCARCHNHKFDPIKQEDYYSLQAVFAGVDRADRAYDADAELGRRRAELATTQREATERRDLLQQKINEAAGSELAAIDGRAADIQKQIAALASSESSPSNGYHSNIESQAEVAKWVQVDLGQSLPIDSLRLHPARPTDFPDSPGFGFPARYRVELSDDAEFQQGIIAASDFSKQDVANPGDSIVGIDAGGRKARYVRVSADKLWPRTNDYVFALAELEVIVGGKNSALNAAVQALDSIEAGRWSTRNLVDGFTSRAPLASSGDATSRREKLEGELAGLAESREQLIAKRAGAALLDEMRMAVESLAKIDAQIAALPAPQVVFAAASQFEPQGSFTPTNGSPRSIHILARGSEKSPLEEVGPGAVGCIEGLSARFALAGRPEGDRRAALAEWIVDRKNPLTWRSIVNRVWHYHFGRGLVDSPNDFGRMGSLPTHPELLDWLAAGFRDGNQSLKDLHRLIVTSAVYKQSSSGHAEGERIDAGNQFLWRMNRRKLEAEALRDAVLLVAGKLDPTMYGPAFREFGFEDDHSPHYRYEEHDPDNAATHRRSVYRFLVRSAPDPFMETLDCADPSMLVEKRNETLTALQALSLLNDKFMVRMAEHFAERVAASGGDTNEQIEQAWKIAFARDPSEEERTVMIDYAKQHGLANACRLILNANEFVFVD